MKLVIVISAGIFLGRVITEVAIHKMRGMCDKKMLDEAELFNISALAMSGSVLVIALFVFLFL